MVAKYGDQYVCVCLWGYRWNHKRDLYEIFVHVPKSVAQSSSGMLTTGRIAYLREGGDWSAQCGQSESTIALLLHILRSTNLMLFVMKILA